jgi:formylglycine-generating enzyme required for sulfatase activity
MTPLMKHHRFALSLCLLAASSTLAADPPYSVRKDTWQNSMAASQEALLRFETEQTRRAYAAALPKGVEIGPWHAVGPFQGKTPHGFNDVFPPQEKIDLGASYEGGKLRWEQHPDWADGETIPLHGGSSAVTYIYRTITAKQPCSIIGHFGADDGMQVWFNGNRVLAKDVPTFSPASGGTVKLDLKPGENRLLLRVNNITGGYSFYFSIAGIARHRQQGERERQQIWSLLRRDFSDPAALRQMNWEREDNLWSGNIAVAGSSELAKRYQRAITVAPLAEQAKKTTDLAALRELYYRSRATSDAINAVRNFQFEPLRLAVADLAKTFGDKYPNAPQFLAKLDAMKKTADELTAAAAKDPVAATSRAETLAADLRALQREALLANPLLDFDRLLVIKRRPDMLGLPQNWQGNCALARQGFDNEIATLSPVRPDGKFATLYRPEKKVFVGDVDLHFDADKMLFSSIGSQNRWHVFEMNADGKNLRQRTPDEPDVDYYDPCYLPDGRILFDSTATFAGVPCVGGGDSVANLCRMDTDGKTIRQLCFDQEHNWCPTVLADGRVLYSRWEYTDTPHYFTRLLFHMNPDGTGQMVHYGSNSYWPNSIFYARPIPDDPNRVVAIISGHHGVPRMGEMVLFDVSKGRNESAGAIQRIPGHAKAVEPVIRDTLVNDSWPKFLHPYPLSGKYFLVSMQPTPQSSWGIYLVDVFDNAVLICEDSDYALLEPVPFRKTPRPPVIPDRVDLASNEGVVYLSDIYAGPGLAGVPRGAVKDLRVFEPHYTYRRMGGHIHVGVDGPWDVHRILGTVPVEEDGSAVFKVPANTPIAVQPLDKDGKALQVMRSWFTAMPGEKVSCVGCHEDPNSTPLTKPGVAMTKPPVEIQPWRGPARGFSFKREVQPVLDRFCVGCHNEQTAAAAKNVPDFTSKPQNGWRNFTPSYLALHPFVRRPGPESDYHLPVPLEWNADTSELVQMLKKGHHNVKLDAEAWDRLFTWIDLNVPDHGTWGEHQPIKENYHARRIEFRTRYANNPTDPEAIFEVKREPIQFVKPEPIQNPKPSPRDLRSKSKIKNAAGWPFDAAEAKRRQAAIGAPSQTKLELAPNIALDLTLIPAGEFVMGNATGCADEQPQTAVKIEKPFYIGACEVTVEQFAAFDPAHDNGYISVFNKDQNTRGVAANTAKQPVIRVSWNRAMEFCAWLSKKTGRKFTLPTEAQWEYACRAGTTTPLNFGDCATDFAKLANLADERLLNLCRGDSPKWIPAMTNINDGEIVAGNVGKYLPNAWGLHDMHGNAAEWTLTTYAPYPYAADGRDSGSPDGPKVARGGSFYDRPLRARSAFRLSYPPWQRVFNVGFRVVCEADIKKIAAK